MSADFRQRVGIGTERVTVEYYLADTARFGLPHGNTDYVALVQILASNQDPRDFQGMTLPTADFHQNACVAVQCPSEADKDGYCYRHHALVEAATASSPEQAAA